MDLLAVKGDVDDVGPGELNYLMVLISLLKW